MIVSMESLVRPMTLQAVGHFFAGIALSLGDRWLSQPAPDSERARAGRKRDALLIVDYLADIDQGRTPERALAPSVPPTQIEVDEACAYVRALAAAGELEVPGVASPPTPGSLDGEQLPPPKWERFLGWLRHEKLNPLAPLAKLKAAYLIALACDLGVAISSIFWGRGNPISALGHSLYQGAALWLGLMVGSLFFKRREHRVPRRIRKQIDKIEERLHEDQAARALVERIVAGARVRLPVNETSAAPPSTRPPDSGVGHEHTD